MGGLTPNLSEDVICKCGTCNCQERAGNTILCSGRHTSMGACNSRQGKYFHIRQIEPADHITRVKTAILLSKWPRNSVVHPYPYSGLVLRRDFAF